MADNSLSMYVSYRDDMTQSVRIQALCTKQNLFIPRLVQFMTQEFKYDSDSIGLYALMLEECKCRASTSACSSTLSTQLNLALESLHSSC